MSARSAMTLAGRSAAARVCRLFELGQAEKLRNGAQVKDWHFAPGTYRVYSITGEFLLLGKVENTVLTTIKSFFEVTKA